MLDFLHGAFGTRLEIEAGMLFTLIALTIFLWIRR
jgi:hypothetical protein